METFTGSSAAYHSTAELPEDAIDLRSAASVRVGVEAALDNAAFFRRIQQGTGIVAPAVFDLASGFSVIDSTTRVIVQEGGVGCAIDFGSRGTLDYIMGAASFTVQTGSSATYVSVSVIRGGTISTTKQTIWIQDSKYCAVTLLFAHATTTAGTYTAVVNVENEATPGTTVIRGQLVFTGQIWRAE